MRKRRRAPGSAADHPSVPYRTEDHVSVLLQMYGSAWPSVLPFCFANTALAFVVGYCDANHLFHLSISQKGHTFLSIMVSFLIITRVHIANQRYMEGRQLLSRIMKSCRELAQHAMTFSRYDQSPKAREWRADLARRTCSLLRTVVVVLEHESSGSHVWMVPELSKDEKQALLHSLGGADERSPLVLAMFLRTSIASHVEQLREPLDVNQELQLLEDTSDFLSAYHGLMKLITTPFPFPLMQMNRLLLFVWVFSLPFALDSTLPQVLPLCFVIFFLTYGFVGLELISMELDDPFGDDVNDFDVLGLAKVVFDDISVTLADVDGEEVGNALLKRVKLPLKEQIAFEVIQRKEYWGGDDGESTAYSGSPATPRESAPLEMTSDAPSPSPSPIKHGHRSQLLNQIRGQKSIGSINVFGTGESLQYDLRAGSVSFDSANRSPRSGHSSSDGDNYM